MKFALLSVLRKAYFEAGFMENLNIFEPQIENTMLIKEHVSSTWKTVFERSFLSTLDIQLQVLKMTIGDKVHKRNTYNFWGKDCFIIQDKRSFHKKRRCTPYLLSFSNKSVSLLNFVAVLDNLEDMEKFPKPGPTDYGQDNM